MSPTDDCNGEVAWGDPHIRPIGAEYDAVQYNYQGIGWFYYLAPCNLTDFENFPFFILSHHERCWWNNNPKGCINNNTLILNTKPNPWVIQFEESSLNVCLYIYAYSHNNNNNNMNIYRLK